MCFEYNNWTNFFFYKAEEQSWKTFKAQLGNWNIKCQIVQVAWIMTTQIFKRQKLCLYSLQIAPLICQSKNLWNSVIAFLWKGVKYSLSWVATLHNRTDDSQLPPVRRLLELITVHLSTNLYHSCCRFIYREFLQRLKFEFGKDATN